MPLLCHAMKEVVFAEINAEDVVEFCMKYKIMQVPTVLYFRNGKFVDRVDSYKPNDISDKISLHVSFNLYIRYK